MRNRFTGCDIVAGGNLHRVELRDGEVWLDKVKIGTACYMKPNICEGHLELTVASYESGWRSVKAVVTRRTLEDLCTAMAKMALDAKGL